VSTLTEIRRAAAAALEGVPGTVQVAIGESEDVAPTRRLIVGVNLGKPSDETRAILDILLESDEAAGSVRALLAGDRTLGGTVSDTYVVGDSGYRLYPGPNGRELGAEFKLDYVD
jgi:hypothetical protein